MKATKFFIGLLFMAISFYAFAEKSPVLMTVDGHEVTKAEFEYIYHKNNTNNAVDKKTLDEYIELFKNFKLSSRSSKSWIGHLTCIYQRVTWLPQSVGKTLFDGYVA